MPLTTNVLNKILKNILLLKENHLHILRMNVVVKYTREMMVIHTNLSLIKKVYVNGKKYHQNREKNMSKIQKKEIVKNVLNKLLKNIPLLKENLPHILRMNVVEKK